MSPSITEEAGKAAVSTIDALKQTPVVLALVIFNVLYLGGSFWAQARQNENYDKAAERWKSLTESAMKQCIPVQQNKAKLQHLIPLGN